MKLDRTTKCINYSLSMMGVLLALMSTKGQAGAMGPEMFQVPGNIYLGVFGGGGVSDKIDISQYGTAFYTEAEGGPLAVNAFGRTNSRSTGLVGGQVGYQWVNIAPNLFDSQWSLTPALEFEGYYLGQSSFTGHDINNETTRLTEHDFLVDYPTSAGIFLINAALTFNSNPSKLHPYIGGGIGAAVQSISRANATQTSPAEPGINHYNSNSSGTDSAFAAQGKIGLSYDLTEKFSVFAEYRGLYIADTSYSFGSTVFPGHPETSNWQVTLDSQYYSLGAAGIRYII